MSVYTSISSHQLEPFLRHYNVGELKQFTGIQAGITNTNYFVDTSTGRYVLTIVESATDVEWFMQLLGFLHQSDIPCAEPLRSADGSYTGTLAGKPATLVHCLKGTDKSDVCGADCRQLGEQIARMHLACRNYPPYRHDSRGLQWHLDTASRVQTKLSARENTLLDREINFQRLGSLDTLPRSVIHADLFRDNVLFDDNTISGIIDVYYACDGCMLYDIAIACNDWCRRPDGTIDKCREEALIDGYESVRRWHLSERKAWKTAIRAAALRFWLSRLQDMHFPTGGEITHIKDPSIFQIILETTDN